MEAARWKIWHHQHPGSDHAIAKLEQRSAMLTFAAWRKTITEGELFSDVFIDMLRSMALVHAEKEEAAAQVVAAFVKLKCWLEQRMRIFHSWRPVFL